MKHYISIIILSIFIPILAQAHSGRTNSEGCHNNRKTGEYHCHKSSASSIKEIRSPSSLKSEVEHKEEYGQVCCKVCTTGKACGNSCISKTYTCHKPPGCACDG